MHIVDAIANFMDLQSIRIEIQVYILPVAHPRIIPWLIGIIHLEMNIPPPAEMNFRN